MLENYIENLLKNKNYDFSNLKINSIKEDNDFYVIYFASNVSTTGRQTVYKINKNNSNAEEVYLPNEDNFEFLDYFENCNFVNIPAKYKGKYF